MNRTTSLMFAAVVLAVALAPAAAGAAEFAGTRTTKVMGAEQRLDPYKNYRARILMDGRVVAGIGALGGVNAATGENWTCATANSPRALYEALVSCSSRNNSEELQAPDARIISRAELPRADVVKHRAGGDAGSVLKSPGRTKFEPITLERGVTQDPGFQQWMKAGQSAARDIQIAAYDEAGNLMGSVTLHRAWVSDHQALPDLDSGANAIAIAHIKLENEGWDQDPPVPSK